ncbi:hypothetical protein IMSAG049_01673 [Clostridiales bacterium]|nr:hypothetical protein IMSAG049_01673 [Clostridiales bacterium]
MLPKLNLVIPGYDEIQLPKMMKVRQKFDSKTIENPAEYLANSVRKNISGDTLESLKGKSIAITAGSRGIPHYMELLKAIVDLLKESGAKPFVFPAMGSHSGATAEGQKDFLKTFGITEESIGAPIKSSMEVVKIGETVDGIDVFCDKYAAEADGIIIFHKIKPHTHFKDIHESGLLKMICIGMGKHEGATAFHMQGFDNFCENMVKTCDVFLANTNIVFSIGVIQNAYDDISEIEAIPTENFYEKDAELLARAKKEMAKFKFDEIDVLIIDEIGKEICGTGFDPNISGRIEVISQQDKFRAIAPSIKKIVLLDITEPSHGNAVGMGEADIVSYRFANKVDFSSTFTNVITNNYLKAAALPLYGNSDLDSIKIAIKTSMVKDLSKLKVVRIKNTLDLFEFEVSSAYAD